MTKRKVYGRKIKKERVKMENKKKGKFKGVKMGSFFLSHLEKLMKLEEGIEYFERQKWIAGSNSL